MSWTRLRAQIIKELLSVLRDPRARLILFGPPLIQLFVFTFAATLEVRNVDIAVHNRDAGAWGQTFVERVAGAGFVRELEPVASQREIAALIERQGALAAIIIPETFSADLVAGRGAQAQLIVDGRRANAGQVAASYIQEIGARLSAEAAGRDANGAAPIASRNWFNPNLRFPWFVAPAIAGVLSAITPLLLSGLSIARERELATFDQLMVSPATPLEIIVSKMAAPVAIGVLLGGLMALAAVFVLGVPFAGSAALLAVAMIAHAVSVVGVGLMISAICETQQQAILGIFAATVPMVLMSGFATPVETMPAAFQVIAEALPLKHFMEIITGSFLKGLPPAVLWSSLWPILVIAVVTLSVATLFVRRRLQ